jgi:hypothetical protein
MQKTIAVKISRRELLKAATFAAVGSILPQYAFSQNARSAGSKTILALGAHYDDCIFGIPGIMLKAVNLGHRVVIISLLGDNKPYDPQIITSSVRVKETLARYRGSTCGVQYAEAVHSLNEYTQEIF